jgi:hypothetical protein
MHTFSQTYQLLEQESLIVRSCLCTGLTDLRKANQEKGRNYTAFFQLSIGIERMAKLALILDYMAQNNLQAPGERHVRAYGHDLVTLYNKVKSTSQLRGHEIASSFALSPLATQVLEFLSDFAKGMRYANLDELATGSSQRKPLEEWRLILQGAVSSKVKAKTAKRSNAIAKVLENKISLISSDLAGTPLSLASYIYEPVLSDAASKHLIRELLSLLAPLRDFIVETSCTANQVPAACCQSTTHIPIMSEFFEFIWLDTKYLQRKKRWP